MTITTRQATHRDLEALAKLYVEFHNYHAKQLPSRLHVLPQIPDQELPGALQRIMADDKAMFRP